jgi:hypothetical protein
VEAAEEEMRRRIERLIASGRADVQSLVDALDHAVRFNKRIRMELPKANSRTTRIGDVLSEEDLERLYWETFPTNH